MLGFLLGRLAAFAATLLAASIVIFLVMEMLPGDPAALMLGLEAREDTLAALRERMGLDRPPSERYAGWMLGMAAGDFGTSYTYSVPVSELVAERLWVSVPLAILALLLAVAVALPLGVLAAARRGSAFDLGVTAVTQLGLAVPNFWFAILLVLLFAVSLRLLPAGGFPGWDAGALPALRALLLPAIALALPQAAILTRIMRSAMLDVMHEDYIRTARAKGLSRSATLLRHGVRNALVPVLTILGLQFAFLLAGAIIIENVFFLPGLGRLVFQAITQRDLIVVQSVIMLLVASIVAVNFLVDIAYAIIDPRLRRGM